MVEWNTKFSWCAKGQICTSRWNTYKCTVWLAIFEPVFLPFWKFIMIYNGYGCVLWHRCTCSPSPMMVGCLSTWRTCGSSNQVLLVTAVSFIVEYVYVCLFVVYMQCVSVCNLCVAVSVMFLKCTHMWLSVHCICIYPSKHARTHTHTYTHTHTHTHTHTLHVEVSLSCFLLCCKNLLRQLEL